MYPKRSPTASLRVINIQIKYRPMQLHIDHANRQQTVSKCCCYLRRLWLSLPLHPPDVRSVQNAAQLGRWHAAETTLSRYNRGWHTWWRWWINAICVCVCVCATPEKRQNNRARHFPGSGMPRQTWQIGRAGSPSNQVETLPRFKGQQMVT